MRTARESLDVHWLRGSRLFTIKSRKQKTWQMSPQNSAATYTRISFGNNCYGH